MTAHPTTHWRKSSFSGGGEGNDCVEVAESDDARIAIRDSKDPARASLSVSALAFALLVDALKDQNGVAVAQVIPTGPEDIPPYPTDPMGEIGLPDLSNDEIEDTLRGNGFSPLVANANSSALTKEL
ncbi:DUF397 domain-containing protein [Streptomyces sp. NPDC050388]|uniref:DUF397 domain-containing protein n=1 Tax=Streptomyces sp. NPDC050388 TaxID=3155781 RepID=UPI00343F5BA5